MKLKNILIVVSDIEKSKAFYKDIFGLEVILDGDENVILTDGLVLQEKLVWKDALGREIITGNNAAELYFEECDIEAIVEKLKRMYPSTEYVTKLTEFPWGQKVVRFYDMDGNLIEIRTPM